MQQIERSGPNSDLLSARKDPNISVSHMSIEILVIYHFWNLIYTLYDAPAVSDVFYLDLQHYLPAIFCAWFCLQNSRILFSEVRSSNHNQGRSPNIRNAFRNLYL